MRRPVDRSAQRAARKSIGASEPLFDAAWKNDVVALRAALVAGANPNAQHPRAGTLPLQLACQADALDAIRVLIDGGAKADAVFTRVSRMDGRTFANHTALMYVQSVAAAELLLDAGARLDDADGKDWTALACAANGAKLPLIEFLLSRGADPNAQLVITKGMRGTVLQLVEHQIDFVESLHSAEPNPAADGRVVKLQAVRDLLVHWMQHKPGK